MLALQLEPPLRTPAGTASLFLDKLELNQQQLWLPLRPVDRSSECSWTDAKVELKIMKQQKNEIDLVSQLRPVARARVADVTNVTGDPVPTGPAGQAEFPTGPAEGGVTQSTGQAEFPTGPAGQGAADPGQPAEDSHVAHVQSAGEVPHEQAEFPAGPADATASATGQRAEDSDVDDVRGAGGVPVVEVEFPTGPAEATAAVARRSRFFDLRCRCGKDDMAACGACGEGWAQREGGLDDAKAAHALQLRAGSAQAQVIRAVVSRVGMAEVTSCALLLDWDQTLSQLQGQRQGRGAANLVQGLSFLGPPGARNVSSNLSWLAVGYDAKGRDYPTSQRSESQLRTVSLASQSNCQAIICSGSLALPVRSTCGAARP